MSEKVITPAYFLNQLMNKYQLDSNSLAKALGITPAAARLLTLGKTAITTLMALRLGKLFGYSPIYWISLQYTKEIFEISNDKKLMKSLNDISKAQKPRTPAKSKKEGKAKISAKPKVKAKTTKRASLSEKRKKAGKAPGARQAKRSRKAR
ncbi:MAG: hypothetical protein LBH44_06140 [Treponema sp.]|jgi:addiction module HigA family antidote|nr:hypothetical protein [Treponema sp.]